VTTTTTTGNILDYMEIAWRSCVRNGGKPDFIEAGATFVDGFRNFMMKTFGRIDFDGASERVIEGGTKVLTFHGSRSCGTRSSTTSTRCTRRRRPGRSAAT
jgi:hypothetical protein